MPDKVSEFENDAKYVKESGLKTINGQSIVGGGDITIGGSGETPSLSDYLSKEEAENTYQPKGTYITKIKTDMKVCTIKDFLRNLLVFFRLKFTILMLFIVGVLKFIN